MVQNECTLQCTMEYDQVCRTTQLNILITLHRRTISNISLHLVTLTKQATRHNLSMYQRVCKQSYDQHQFNFHKRMQTDMSCGLITKYKIAFKIIDDLEVIKHDIYFV